MFSYERCTEFLEYYNEVGEGSWWTSPMFLHQPHCNTPEIQCTFCKKTFETGEDFKWHKETQYGREDCSILRSMLNSSY